MIQAKVIADSVSPEGYRLTTVEAKYPRCIHGEVMTHRTHSRNTRSSRAVPVRKVIEEVKTDPFIPLKWQSAQAGMRGGEEVSAEEAEQATMAWLSARNLAVEYAEELLALGIHKTMPNRLLEPFAWHTAILSATAHGWRNFFNQRVHPDAEIHMQATAVAIKDAYDGSRPRFLQWDDWHLPYITEGEVDEHGLAILRKLSVARCARVSYLNHDGEHDVPADVALYNKLTSADPPHWSPLEHVATPARRGVAEGNFRGWHQLRHLYWSVP